jgi:hypothetical protein
MISPEDSGEMPEIRAPSPASIAELRLGGDVRYAGDEGVRGDELATTV